MSTHPDGYTLRPTWADIDGSAFARNLATVAAGLPSGSRLVAVLKADGYGHGALELARRCLAPDVAMIAVALVEEALELRRGDIELPILVMGPALAEQMPLVREHRLTLGVVGPEELRVVCRESRGLETHIHLKLDSGMGRMGLVETELAAAATMLREHPSVMVDAIYTHFANAGDAGDTFTDRQLGQFASMLETLREMGIRAPLHHSANSAATMRGVVTPGDLVRVGLSLYGAEPLDTGHSRLEPVLRWRTEIIRLKTLPAGHAIGYGTTFHTTRESRIATLPVGYADGYDRGLSNRGQVLVRGRRAPVVGRVSMDLITVDVTDVPGASMGDEVVLIGGQESDFVSADELAAMTGTIPYEVFCRISARVPRRYGAAVRSRFLP